ncbi:hypothetical protein AVEN_144817-1, partial [Araneus ventricosus]
MSRKWQDWLDTDISLRSE